MTQRLEVKRGEFDRKVYLGISETTAVMATIKHMPDQKTINRNLSEAHGVHGQWFEFMLTNQIKDLGDRHFQVFRALRQRIQAVHCG